MPNDYNKNIGKLLIRGKELGMIMCKEANISDVVISEWVRWKCKYGCKYYGQKLSCPPYSPTPKETRKLIAEYKYALLIKGTASWKVRYAVGELEKFAFLLGLHKAFALGAGPCMLCDFCVVSLQNGLEQRQNKPCKYPGSARPSMEACGIDVFETVRSIGCSIHWSGSNKKNNPPKEQAIDVFGLLLLT